MHLMHFLYLIGISQHFFRLFFSFFLLFMKGNNFDFLFDSLDHEAIPIVVFLNVLNYYGHLKNINFPFGTNGKLMVLGVPMLK